MGKSIIWSLQKPPNDQTLFIMLSPIKKLCEQACEKLKEELFVSNHCSITLKLEKNLYYNVMSL